MAAAAVVMLFRIKSTRDGNSDTLVSGKAVKVTHYLMCVFNGVFYSRYYFHYIKKNNNLSKFIRPPCGDGLEGPAPTSGVFAPRLDIFSASRNKSTDIKFLGIF